MAVKMAENSIKGKRIVVGITGSIAAYKAADLVRKLQDEGAEIRVVMTQAACEFITPLTLQALSGHPVATDLLDADQEASMGHITLARWADWIVIAPASADSIAKLVQGRTNDLLAAVCIASESPLAIAPAMNNKMWQNQATQDNINILKSRNIHIIGPASGLQACGELGEGRLVEPVDIVLELQRLMVPKQLTGKRVLVTAGPTHEPIDPVRFIGNRSSGKMGFAVAKAAKEAGAEVDLVAGPVHLSTPTGVKRVNVTTAQQMYDAVMENIINYDIFISCAAVADYTPAQVVKDKIKKTQNAGLELKLEATKDIISSVADLDVKPFIVGFAAETNNVVDYAQQKLQRKKLDMIAANQVGDSQGFAVDNNSLQVFWQQDSQMLPLAPKLQLARDLMTLIIELYNEKDSTENS
jgi:phosphopantothenoylcysteine decarboxylase/phosphopantothenate--cysteine ligase